MVELVAWDKVQFRKFVYGLIILKKLFRLQRIESRERTVYHQLFNILIKQEIISTVKICFIFQSSESQILVYAKTPECYKFLVTVLCLYVGNLCM